MSDIQAAVPTWSELTAGQDYQGMSLEDRKKVFWNWRNDVKNEMSVNQADSFDDNDFTKSMDGFFAKEFSFDLPKAKEKTFADVKDQDMTFNGMHTFKPSGPANITIAKIADAIAKDRGISRDEVPIKDIFESSMYKQYQAVKDLPGFVPTATQDTGKMGIIETLGRKDPLEMLPFSFQGANNLDKLRETVERLQSNTYKEDDQGNMAKDYDRRIIEDYFNTLDEYDKRGGFLSKTTDILSIMPKYLLEFMATGGMGSIGSGAARNIGVRILEKYGEEGLKNMVIKGGTRL